MDDAKKQSLLDHLRDYHNMPFSGNLGYKLYFEEHRIDHNTLASEGSEVVADHVHGLFDPFYCGHAYPVEAEDIAYEDGLESK